MPRIHDADWNDGDAVPDDEHDTLTPDEKKAVASLQRLAKKWPPSLLLFATGDGGLAVCHSDDPRFVGLLDITAQEANGLELAWISFPAIHAGLMS